MENAGTIVAQISHNDGVSTEILASAESRNIFIELHTSETVVIIETGLTWRYTRLAELVELIRVLCAVTQNTI